MVNPEDYDVEHHRQALKIGAEPQDKSVADSYVWRYNVLPK